MDFTSFRGPKELLELDQYVVSESVISSQNTTSQRTVVYKRTLSNFSTLLVNLS